MVRGTVLRRMREVRDSSPCASHSGAHLQGGWQEICSLVPLAKWFEGFVSVFATGIGLYMRARCTDSRPQQPELRNVPTHGVHPEGGPRHGAHARP